MRGRFITNRISSMSLLGRLLGYASIVVHLCLSIALLVLGVIGELSGSVMQMGLVPDWFGSVARTVCVAGLFGLVAVVLATRPSKLARTALVVWCLIVSWILASAFWSSTYRFDGLDDFTDNAWILLGALLLLIGSWVHRSAAGRKR